MKLGDKQVEFIQECLELPVKFQDENVNLRSDLAYQGTFRSTCCPTAGNKRDKQGEERCHCVTDELDSKMVDCTRFTEH